MSEDQLPLALDLPMPRLGLARRKGLDKFCLYCGHPGDTRDHVPPRALLIEPWPNNLRTVPACADCNRSWSLDEEHLAIVLALIGHTPHLLSQVEEGGKFDRALTSSTRREDLILTSLSVSDDGRVQLEPNKARITRIIEKVVFGLHALRYGRGSDQSDFTCVLVAGPGEDLSPCLTSALWLRPGIRRKRWTTVQPDVFSFLFAKSWLARDPPLYCFVDLHGTMVAAVGCPSPLTRKRSRLSSPPW